MTESVNPITYWRKLKQRLKEEGNETVTNCHGLKMIATDGKMRLTDVADTEQAVKPETFDENKIVAAQGGNVAKVARKELEAKRGKKVATGNNAKSLLNSKK